LKTLRLAAILIAVYILVPALILGSTFSRPDVLTVETIIQFLMGIILFSLLPHAPACLVLFLMMVSKGIYRLAELRQHKSVMLSAIFVLITNDAEGRGWRELSRPSCERVYFTCAHTGLLQAMLPSFCSTRR